MGVNWGDEGYCTVCRFILPLNAAGELVRHTRKEEGLYGARKPCRGRTPGKTAPLESRASAFSTRAPRVRCPECRSSLKANPDLENRRRVFVPWHEVGDGQCPGSFLRVERSR